MMFAFIWYLAFVIFSQPRNLLSDGLHISRLPDNKGRTSACIVSPLLVQKTATTKDATTNPPNNSKIAEKVAPNARSTAIFALMEDAKKSKSFFAIRKLESNPDYLSLARRDRAFARLLLTTAERRRGQIDKVIQRFTKEANNPNRKIRPVDRLCEATLRIGAAQLLFTDVAPYAVLKETVDVLRMHPKINVLKSRISYVNAVLRAIDREGTAELKKTSVIDNCEPKLIQEWIKAYGEEKTTAIVEASMKQSPIFISINHRTGSIVSDQENSKIESLVKKFDMSDSYNAGEEAEILPQGSIQIPRQYMGAVSSWPLYEEGDWWVQDPSATLPAIALHEELTRAGDPVEEMHVVDLCSAPGGKTAQLCSLGFGKVTAVELSPRRIKPLQDNLQRLNMAQFCDIHVADGRKWMPETGDDNPKIRGVLVDAPCSATGVGSRRPEVLRKSPDLGDLLIVQRELAAHAADNLLEPGGIMVYATCSLLKQESEDQMDWLLSRSEGAKLETVPLVPREIPGFDDAIDENGWLRVLPGVLPGSLGSCDGFFVARLRKVS